MVSKCRPGDEILRWVGGVILLLCVLRTLSASTHLCLPLSFFHWQTIIQNSVRTVQNCTHGEGSYASFKLGGVSDKSNASLVTHNRISAEYGSCSATRNTSQHPRLLFAEYNQQDATFLNLFIYLCKTLYVFQKGFPSIIRSSKLHTQRQVLSDQSTCC